MVESRPARKASARGAARGAKRRYSRFAGELQPLAKVRVGWFEKEGRELVRISTWSSCCAPEAAAVRPRRAPPGRLSGRDGLEFAQDEEPASASTACSTPRSSARGGRRPAASRRATSRAGCCGSRESSRRRRTARSAARRSRRGRGARRLRRSAALPSLRGSRPGRARRVAGGDRVLAADRRARVLRGDGGGVRRRAAVLDELEEVARPGAAALPADTSCGATTVMQRTLGDASQARRRCDAAPMKSLPGADPHAVRVLGRRRAACCSSRYDLEVGRRHDASGHLPARARARSPGASPTCSRRAGRPTAATATIRSGSASTTSSR